MAVSFKNISILLFFRCRNVNFDHLVHFMMFHCHDFHKIRHASVFRSDLPDLFVA